VSRCSVVIPVWNGARFLDAAVASVLAQDEPPLEVIVVDDGSDDDTPAVLARWPSVVAIRQPHQGVATARNVGCARARGELIALQDADDLWAPHKLRLQIAHLDAHPEHGYVAAHYVDFLEHGMPRPAWSSPEPRAGAVGNLVVRRAVWLEVGPFDPMDPSDLDWSLRARELGIRAGVVPEVLLFRRVHGGNATHTSDGRAIRMRALGAALRRRRQAPLR
jgi:glycosyltransferase involved in cell wall biosynthesis